MATVKRSFGRKIVGFLASVFVLSGAVAQEAPTSNDDQILEEIVVTGSRIARDSVFDTTSPTVTISGAEFDKRGITNVVDALNDTPGFTLSQTSAGNQNNLTVGTSFANMFGLGSQRTLTLMDGKRIVSTNPPQIQGLAGGSQVDLNLIPVALIDRVEVIGIGGAPIYGSDAIAGTINIIMKDDFEGFEISGQYNFIQNNGGDPEDKSIQAVWGVNAADGRGNLTFAAGYEDNKGVLVDDFPRFFGPQPSFREIPGVRDVDGDGVLDGVNQLFFDVRIPVQTNGPGAVLMPSNIFLPFAPAFGFSVEEALALSRFPNTDQYLQITAAGELTEFDPGVGLAGDPFSAVGGDGLDRDLRNQLVSPVERVTSMVTGHYEIAPSVEVYGQGNFSRIRANTLADQKALNIFPFGNESGALAFSIDTPFLSDAQRQTLIDAGAGDIFFAQVAPELVVDNGKASSETFFWRFVGGVRGEFEFANRQWNWDASANYGQSTIESRETGFNDGRFFNAVDAIRLSDSDIQTIIDADNGIDTVDGALAELSLHSGTGNVAANDVICRAVLEVARGDVSRRQSSAGGAGNDVFPDIDGCIPLNLLATPGPADAISFVQRAQFTTGKLEQRVVNGSVSGEVVKLPAGWLQAVLGYEGRREIGSFKSDEATQIGIGRNSPILDTKGVFTTDEVFFELRAPIISPEMGFVVIDDFTLEGAARTVDNSITGRDPVWTIGGRLAFGGVFSDLMFRGNITQSTRAPSIQELFSPRVTTRSFSNDPCDVRFREDGPAPQNRQANCDAAGLAPDFSALVVRASQEGVSGGNPNLGVEKADSYSFGGVFTPGWIPGFSISADYIRIKIKDRITRLTLQGQMQACFDQTPGPNALNAPVCNSFQRDAQGQIIGFSSGWQNAASSSFRAVQLQSAYQFQLADFLGSLHESWGGGHDWGSISFSTLAFNRIENSFSVIGEEAAKRVGGFNEPRWSGYVDTTWDKGAVSLFWRVQWQGKSKLDPQGDNFFEDLDGNLITKTDSRFINDIGATYSFRDRLSAQFIVNNVLKRRASDIEIAASGGSDVVVSFGNLGLDEIFGRRYTLRLTATF